MQTNPDGLVAEIALTADMAVSRDVWARSASSIAGDSDS